MKSGKLIASAVLALAAGSASAIVSTGPTFAVTPMEAEGPGEFSFSGMGDASYAVLLAPGSYDAYSFSVGFKVPVVGNFFNGITLTSGKGFSQPFLANSANFWEWTGVLAGNDVYFVNVDANITNKSYLGGLSVSPVPEPETYALMLAGLAALGFMVRRRKAD